MLNQNQIENENKEINKSIIIKDLTDNYYAFPKGIDFICLFRTKRQIKHFLDIFDSYLELLGYETTTHKYKSEIKIFDQFSIATYNNEKGKQQKLYLKIAIYKLHNHLVLLAAPENEKQFSNTRVYQEIIRQFFTQLFFDNLKSSVIDLHIAGWQIAFQYSTIIKYLLDYSLYKIGYKEYWLASEQRTNKTLVETLKNESILEKL